MHSLLENYLVDVAQQLRSLPVAQRNEELREMRQHLLNAVIVNREMGQSEDEAVHTALEQFGDAEELGGNLVWAWERGRSQEIQGFWLAAACSLALLFLIPLLLKPLINGGPPLYIYGFNVAGLTVVPFFLAGVLNGCSFPRRGSAGTGLSVAVWLVYSLTHALLDSCSLGQFQLWMTNIIMAGLAMIVGGSAGSRWQLARTRWVRRARG